MFGTFVLVLGGCGTALFGHVGFLGVAVAFGLTVVAMAYGVGHISGAHLNPAVSFGVFVNGRMNCKEMLSYWAAQCIGAILAACLLFFVWNAAALGQTGVFAANGFGKLSPEGYSFCAAMVTEIVLTFIFVIAILGVTSKKAGHGSFAGLVIGFTLVLVHILGIGLTGTSVNPARSFGPALLAGGDALACVWVFIVAPLIGGALAAVVYNGVAGKNAE